MGVGGWWIKQMDNITGYKLQKTGGTGFHGRHQNQTEQIDNIREYGLQHNTGVGWVKQIDNIR